MVLIPNFFSKSSDMDINGSLSYNHIIAPDFFQNFFSFENFFCVGSQKVKQIKLLFRKKKLLTGFGNSEVIFINNKVTDFNKFCIIGNLRGQL